MLMEICLHGEVLNMVFCLNKANAVMVQSIVTLLALINWCMNHRDPRKFWVLITKSCRFHVVPITAIVLMMPEIFIHGVAVAMEG